MVSSPQSPGPPHQYPEAIRRKLYQAFIFLIPFLFSIILFLLFYLFYLKRRASGNSSAAPVLLRTLNDANITMAFDLDLKNKLYTTLFDEQMKPSDSLCSVCLGEFEMKEELLQLPSCKHVFHIDCIRHWLHSNSTCPLCRGSVMSDGKSGQHHHHRGPNLMPENSDGYHHVLVPPLSQQQHSLSVEGSASGSDSIG